MATCQEPGCRLRLPCPKHPSVVKTRRYKDRKNWKDRIRFAQRHPIRVAEIRELRNHPEVFQALAALREE